MDKKGKKQDGWIEFYINLFMDNEKNTPIVMRPADIDAAVQFGRKEGWSGALDEVLNHKLAYLVEADRKGGKIKVIHLSVVEKLKEP